MSAPVVSLEEAVAANVHAGDAVHVVTGHTRWTAAAREVMRQWWGKDPGFTLVMLSLSSLGAAFFRGRLLSKVVTGYSGDVFPNFTPNRWFGDAYLSGEVEVEHWSFLTFLQRLEAAARGLPAIVTTSLDGSSMADNPGFAVIESPFGGRVGLLEPLAPDVALLHAPLADVEGNVALSPPLLEGVWGALAARRGAVVTCERIVEDIRPWSHLVRVPAHRVLSLTVVPHGAHPGGLYVPHLPVEAYGEDLEYWEQVREASRGDDFDAFIEQWILGPRDQQEYLELLGSARLERLRRRAEPDSWRDDEAAHPPDLAAPVGAWELATVFGARHVADRVLAGAYDAVLAGAGVANLCAWLAVRLARQQGSEVVLTAELGLWGYEPTPADPFVFNHRSFPSATMVSDSETVLSTLVAGPGTRLLGCLGAAQIDCSGNVNSTVIPGRAFLVGSGGGNDVASGADEVVVVATLAPRRTVEEVPYVTSPGTRVTALVTDSGVFERRDGRFVLTAVPEGPGSIEERVDAVRDRCGWELERADVLAELPAPSADEIETIRRWDPEQRFLRPDGDRSGTSGG
ncbi:MAG TPA: CoA-transferase [Acidimicrobiales bacterium]|nr:CoA-transferase [Acidimicrobiales bacterium]